MAVSRWSLEACRYDQPSGGHTLRLKELARQYGISRRSVFRVLAKQ
jgi:DNA-binding IclR family transcriptional regulator